MRYKKSQMKMGETIAVLIVFFMLLFFGLIFYSNMEKKGIQKQVAEIQERTSIDTAQKIQFLPELKCTTGEITETLCMDSLKLMAFQNISAQNVAYYQSIFGSTKIEVAEIYPEYKNYTVIYEGPTSNQYFITYIPISIFEPMPYPGNYKIGMLKTTSYMFT